MGHMNNARTDSHRPGVIVPEHYRFVLAYSRRATVDSQTVPPFGINCEAERREHRADGKCCATALRTIARVRFADHGGLGVCTICGTEFAHGEVWVHEASGEHIHVGHTCADKYGMLAERGEHDAAYAAVRLAALADAERAEFLAEHPGLAAALATDHPLTRDLAASFRAFRSLSAPQVALAFKLAADAASPKAEAHVAAPEGKVTVRGEVVSVKTAPGFRPGEVETKITVKVTTAAGTWLAWGTLPAGLAAHKATLRGCEVEFTATLTRGRDAHFAIFKRPMKASVVARPAALAA